MEQGLKQVHFTTEILVPTPPQDGFLQSSSLCTSSQEALQEHSQAWSGCNSICTAALCIGRETAGEEDAL